MRCFTPGLPGSGWPAEKNTSPTRGHGFTGMARPPSLVRLEEQTVPVGSGVFSV